MAKDEEKQRQIKEKSAKDAASTHARAIGPLATVATASSNSSNNPSLSRINTPTVPNSAKPPAAIPEIAKAAGKVTVATGAVKSTVVAAVKSGDAGAAKSGRISMSIQAIPPFKGKRVSIAPPGANGAAAPTASTSGVNGAQARAAAANAANSPLSPTSQNRLNVNASSFRPTSKPFSPVCMFNCIFMS